MDLATVAKKIPLLPAPAKTTVSPKKRTYIFTLKLGESNDKIYPEFSWKDLVQEADLKRKRAAKAKGHITLDPYASDDDEDLKEMAAKFEKKYSTSKPKSKREREDYVDKGAGYDETDSFIDNTDIYDEIVPQDLQTIHGGFYINSGSLEYKEVECTAEGDADDDDNDNSSKIKPTATSTPTTSPPKTRPSESSTITNAINAAVLSGTKQSPVKEEPSKPNTPIPAKKPRRKSTDSKLVKTPTSTSSISKPSTATTPKLEQPQSKEKDKDSKVVVISSTDHSSSSSGDDSSDSSSDTSSSSEDDAASKKNKIIKATIFKKSATALSNSSAAKTPPTAMPTLQSTTAPARRLKVKNVPLNPLLHGNLTSATTPTTTPSQTPTLISNRTIFSNHAHTPPNVKALNQLPPGLTVTANVGPPKLSPINFIHGNVKIPPAKRRPGPKPGLTSAPTIKKPRKQKLATNPSPSSAAAAIQQLQSAVGLMSPMNLAAKYSNSANAVFQNYQFLAGMNRPAFGMDGSKSNKSTRVLGSSSNTPPMKKSKMSGSPAGSGGSALNLSGSGMMMTEVKDRKSSSPATNKGFNNLNLGINPRLPNSITITPSSSGGGGSNPTATARSPLNLTSSPNLTKKVTAHDVNSLLKKDLSGNVSVASMLSSANLEKIFGSSSVLSGSSVKELQRK